MIQGEVAAEEIPEQKQEEKIDAGRLLLAPISANEPIVYCTEIKPITNLNFSLMLSAMAVAPQQKTETKRLLYFISETGEELCPRKEICLTMQEHTKVNFSLNASASSLEKCYLVIKSSDHSHNEAYQLVEFSVKIAFSIEFDF